MIKCGEAEREPTALFVPKPSGGHVTLRRQKPELLHTSITVQRRTMAAGGIVTQLVTRSWPIAEARRSSRARFTFGAPIVFAAAFTADAMDDPVTVGPAGRDQGHLVIVRASYILKVRGGRA